MYNTLWSHADGVPVVPDDACTRHIHYVVQPVTGAQVAQFGSFGPRLQVDMFARNEPLHPADVAAVCERARALW